MKPYYLNAEESAIYNGQDESRREELTQQIMAEVASDAIYADEVIEVRKQDHSVAFKIHSGRTTDF